MKDLLVAKYGSRIVTGPEGIDQGMIDLHARQLASVKDRFDLIVVTSGAVAAGRNLWLSRPDASSEDLEPSLQSLASIGSPGVFTAWQRAFSRYGLVAGAISITHREIDDKSEGPMLLRSLEDNRRSGMATVLNENDAVSDEELALLAYGGDNDGLASHIARAVGAHSMILFTSKGGFFDDYGVEIPLIMQSEFQQTQEMVERRESSESGTGGAPTKLIASKEAAEDGISTHVARWDDDIEAVLAGQKGTLLVANEA